MKEYIRRLAEHYPSSLAVLFYFTTLLTALAQEPANTDTAQYLWLHPEYNMIQFQDRKVLENFRKSWKSYQTHKVSIVHLGDSHLQPDVFPTEVRTRLQNRTADGGRGLIFPFSAAKTYSPIGYQTTYTGKWTYAKSFILPPKIPLGVSGMSLHTTDSFATFAFTFKDPVPENYNRLLVFFKKHQQSFDFIIETNTARIDVIVSQMTKDSLPFAELRLPPFDGHMRLHVKKHRADQKEFEFYGMSLETATDKGLIYHTAGVGGAAFRSILYEEHFKKQLPALQPDLVIVDFGTNDYLYDDSIKPELSVEIKQIISMIRAVVPKASIILTSTQDMRFRKGILHSGPEFSKFMRQIAKEENCGFYDWFWISGGMYSADKWAERELIQNDFIHLNWKGARLKGKLFSEALLNTLDYLEQKKTDSLFFNTDSLENKQRNEYKPVVVIEPKPGKKFVYTVRSGDNLSTIAKKNRVSISNLMKWNNKKNSKIRAGEKLIIYRK
ncbi:MAG: GDSL-type esterase/lipase family protein [Cytophagaceae bacterium]